LGCAAAGRNAAEIENCDGDASFVISLLSTSDNLNNFYDDWVRFRRSQSASIWQNVTSADPTSDNDVVKDTDLTNGVLYIGPRGSYDVAAVGNALGAPGTNPPRIRLDVDGNILAEERIGADLLCMGTTANCFEPDSLYDLDCPDTAGGVAQYMRGVAIVGNRLVPDCGDIEFVDAFRTCPNTDGRVRIMYSNGDPPVCERP